MFIFINEIGSTNVGGQHALFNQAMRIIPNAWLNTQDFAKLITDNLGFSGFKLDCTALLTSG